MKIKNKIISTVLLIVIIGTIFLSSTLIVEKKHHHDFMDPCKICVQIDKFIHIINEYKYLLIAISSLILLRNVLINRKKNNYRYIFIKNTLVSEKIKLLD